MNFAKYSPSLQVHNYLFINYNLFWKKGKKNFFINPSVADLHVFLYGLHNSWTNVNSHRLQSPSTKFPSGPLTSDKVSHLMPLLDVGAFIGNLTYSLVVSKFGIKRPLMFLALPHFVNIL